MIPVLWQAKLALADSLDDSLRSLQQQALHAVPFEKFRAFNLLKDPNFLSAWQDILTGSKWKNCVYIEIGFLIFMVFFKAWQQAEQRHWLGRVAVGFYCSIFFWAGELIVIPYFSFGNSYRVIVKGLWSLH